MVVGVSDILLTDEKERPAGLTWVSVENDFACEHRAELKVTDLR